MYKSKLTAEERREFMDKRRHEVNKCPTAPRLPVQIALPSSADSMCGSPLTRAESVGVKKEGEVITRARRKRKCLFSMTIDLKSGVSGIVKVREGDSPEALAKNFARMHGLGEELLPQLIMDLERAVEDGKRQMEERKLETTTEDDKEGS